MNLYLIEMFGVSLLLTLLIELNVAMLFQIPFGKNLLPVVLVNVLTNPVAVLFCWLWRMYLPQIDDFWIQVPLEGIVIAVEFLIYRSFAGSGWKCQKPFVFSAVANGASWLLGVLISVVR